uniref:NADAR domain-containing protein n=1 Tax=Strongyloides venezuelensis TaxID=75913 RepID=A0A0K0FVK4_STRVS
MPFFKYCKKDFDDNRNTNFTDKLFKDFKVNISKSENEGSCDNSSSWMLPKFRLNELKYSDETFTFSKNEEKKNILYRSSNDLKPGVATDNDYIEVIERSSPLAVKYEISPGKVIVIYDSSNIYSIAYNKRTFIYNGRRYTSVDHVYQHYMLKEFCNKKMEKTFFNMKRSYLYRNYVKKCLKLYKKTNDDIIEWRKINGLEIITQATVEKFKQNKDLLEIMKKDRAKIILNAYGRDRYDSCGPIKKLRQWMNKNIYKTVDVPVYEEPICLEYYPTISEGKNIQGILVMLARAILIENGFLE